MSTMQITLSSPTHLRIVWPLLDDQIEAEVKRRLATVPGIEAGRGREAWAPVIQLQRIMELYPKASFDYAAIQRADGLAATYYAMLVRLGIMLGFDEQDDVCGVGENVSPLVQELIRDRSHALRPFVEEAMKHPAPFVLRGPLPEIPVAAGTLTEVQYPKRKSGTRKRRTKA